MNDWQGWATLLMASGAFITVIFHRIREYRRQKFSETEGSVSLNLTERADIRKDRLYLDRRLQERIGELEALVEKFRLEHIECIKSDSASRARLEVLERSYNQLMLLMGTKLKPEDIAP